MLCEVRAKSVANLYKPCALTVQNSIISYSKCSCVYFFVAPYVW